MTVEGIYEDGKVTLLETPPGVERARVTVTFLPDPDAHEDGAEGRRDAALRRMMDFMRQGLDFGNGKFDREEIYRERLEQLERRHG